MTSTKYCIHNRRTYRVRTHTHTHTMNYNRTQAILTALSSLKRRLFTDKRVKSAAIIYTACLRYDQKGRSKQKNAFICLYICMMYI